VAIARCLINSPQVILADEPTGNLDSASGEEILRIFAKLHEQGRTVIVVTHDPQVAERAQRIIEIADGRITSDRAPAGRDAS
jgi:ABC-type lipoprotein export system ATPase subunit